MRKRIEKDDIRRSEPTRKFSDRSTGPSSENRGRSESRASSSRSGTGTPRPYAGDRNQDRERKPYSGDRNSDRPRTPYAGDRNQDRERKPYSGDRNSDRPRTPYAGDRNQDRERNDTHTRSEEGQYDREQQDNGSEPRAYKPRYTTERETTDRSLESSQEFRPKRAFDGPKRNFSGDRKPSTGDRASYNRDEKNDRPKRSFDSPRDENQEPRDAFQGKFSKRDTFKSRNRYEERPSFTPQYKLDRFKENAPAKIQKKIREVDGKSDLVRLNRFIANAGICSRRDADKLIAAGEIKVNNKVVIEMGYQVAPTDIVKYGNRKLNREKPAYVLLNKPKDFLTTTEDPNDRKTVMELVKNAGDARIYPVGRLDRNTTGLLLLTNDGELADRLTHPSHEIEKIYQAELDKPLTDEDFEKIKAGLTLEDGEIKVDDLAKVTPDGYVIGVKIHSGKNRIVRRIFEHLGYEVTKLDRTTFAGLTKKDLPRGHWRYLTERELVKLKYFM
jgi:23S rRNA pseudouridine2605 synthase